MKIWKRVKIHYINVLIIGTVMEITFAPYAVILIYYHPLYLLWLNKD